MKINKDFFVIKISKQLQNSKRNKMTVSTMGYLGIQYSEEKSEKGFFVTSTQEGSPAFEAGFKFGDIITAINNKSITTHTELVDLVTQYKPGETITISFINSFSINDQVSNKKVQLGERPLVLDVPAGSQDMRFNLQFGEIIMIGENAAKIFPEAVLGHNLLIHHSVEYKERAEGDKNWNDWHLIESDQNFEYRLVHAEKEVLGVWDMNESDISKSVIPFKDFIFCHSSYVKSEFQFINGVWQPMVWEKSFDELTEQLDELKAQIEELNTDSVMKQMDNEENYKQKGFIKKAIDSINKERADITRKMHQKRLVEVNVIFVNQLTNTEYSCLIEPGDKILVDYFTLYPLDIYGTHYVLVRPNHSEALIKN